MGLFSNFFRPKIELASKGFVNPVHVELHSHLLPGIDDGVESFEESLEIIRSLHQLGYKKIITTPHIMGDFYRNSQHNIYPLLEQLREQVEQAGIPIQIEAAAEYMVDELLEEKIKKKELLTFSGNHVLIEMPFVKQPENFKQVAFELQLNGYKVILAHPERYPFLSHDKEKLEDLFYGGLLFQVNICSLIGQYTPEAKKTAEYLIDKKMVSFVGSDMHGPRNLPGFKFALHTKYYEKVCELNLLNNSLL